MKNIPRWTASFRLPVLDRGDMVILSRRTGANGKGRRRFGGTDFSLTTPELLLLPAFCVVAFLRLLSPLASVPLDAVFPVFSLDEVFVLRLMCSDFVVVVWEQVFEDFTGNSSMWEDGEEEILVVSEIGLEKFCEAQSCTLWECKLFVLSVSSFVRVRAAAEARAIRRNSSSSRSSSSSKTWNNYKGKNGNLFAFSKSKT